MDNFREQEILFEYKDGQWHRFDEDPEDPEYEIESIVKPAHIYKNIANLKHKGWHIREVDNPSNNEIILYKKVRIPDPAFNHREIIFEYVNMQWYRFEKDSDDEEFVSKRYKLTPRQAENQIQLFKNQGWKIKESNSSFSGVILYMPDEEDE